MAAIIVPAGLVGGAYQIVGAFGGAAESTVLFDASGFIDPGSAGLTSSTFSSATPINVGGGANGTTNLCLLAALNFVGANGGTTTSPSLTWDRLGAAQAMTLVPSASISNGASGGDIFWFYLMNPTLGLQQLSASWTGANQVTMQLASFVAVDQTGGATSFPTVVTNTGTAASASVSISTTPTTRKFVAAFSTPGNFAVASGTDIGHKNTGNVFSAAGNWDVGTATSLSYSIGSSSGFDGVAVTIKGA